MPVRIQRKRTKGWKMPPNTVYVGRPTKWGNPFRAEEWGRDIAVHNYEIMILDRPFATKGPDYVAEIQRELRGKNLACWCPLDQPCHADVLLEIANGTEPSRAGTHATVVLRNEGADTKGEKGE